MCRANRNFAFCPYTMKKKSSRKPESFIRQPNYPGGAKALDQFIKTHLRYPEEAIQHKIEGTVSVNYDLDVFGDVIEATIKHGIGYGCDEEALRIVKLLKFEKRRYQGMRVVFHRNINIHFRLHVASTPPPQEQTVKYNYTEAKKDPGSSGSYEIKINLGN